MTTSDQPAKIISQFHLPRWGWWILAGVGVLVVIVGAGLGTVWAMEQNTIIPHATVAGIEVGGLTKDEALTKVTNGWNTFTKNGLTFVATDGTSTIVPVISGAGDDSTTVAELVSFVPTDAVREAYAFGHSGSWTTQLRYRVSGWLSHRHEFGIISLDAPALTDLLHQKVGGKDTNAVDASFTLTTKGAVTLLPSATGSSIDYGSAVSLAQRRVRQLSSASIALRVVTTNPEVSSNDSLAAIAAAEAPPILAHAPITLTIGDGTQSLDRKTLLKILGFVYRDNQVHVGLDAIAAKAYLTTLAQTVNTPVQEARFSIVNGQVQAFSTPTTGEAINIDKSLAALEQAVIQDGASAATLVVDVTQPVSTSLPSNSFGITELVAEGKTNFKGSPTNRRFNLTLGATRLNGLLIKPGAEFSLVQALGQIDAAHGWRPELVILGKDIKPEFGGGLCQVATTLFRAVLNAGLPVTERHNHSLRIRYYEPPVGLDATIYDPQPDFRFVNDYTGYLLLQTQVSGNDLIFQFYGTKDNRTVSIPTPKVYNQTAIPPTQTVETTDLKPGEKKCQTPGHPGADATATYTVTYADGHVNKQIFQSHYSAMPVICQVGKKPAPKPKVPATNANTNTSTNTNAAVNTNTTVDTNAAVNTNTATNS